MKNSDFDLIFEVVVFDEIDAISRVRGGHNAKARDGALHQLLCELDGLRSIDNLLVIIFSSTFIFVLMSLTSGPLFGCIFFKWNLRKVRKN